MGTVLRSGAFALMACAVACSFQPGQIAGGDATANVGDGGTDGTSTSGCDAARCTAAGGSCDTSGECVISYDGNGAVTCPAGMPCVVFCLTGNNSCQGGVDCRLATSCRVLCRGNNACTGGVLCGSGTCDVDCRGTNACQNESCPVQPASCTFNCCGNHACDGTLCSGCAITNACN